MKPIDRKTGRRKVFRKPVFEVQKLSSDRCRAQNASPLQGSEVKIPKDLAFYSDVPHNAAEDHHRKPQATEQYPIAPQLFDNIIIGKQKETQQKTYRIFKNTFSADVCDKSARA